MKNKYSFAPAKQQAEEKDQHSAAWINLLKPASVKAAEADREVQAYKEHLALQSARESELDDIRRASARRAEEAEERLKAMRDAFEKEKRDAALSREVERELRIDSLENATDMVLEDVPLLIAERDEQIEELQSIVNEMADVLESVIEAVRAIGASITAPKVRRAIRDAKGDIVETQEFIVDEAKDEQP
jgi:hypothetical protein